MEENVGTPPQALFDAMDAHIGERAAKGVFLDGGGLYGTEDAVNFVVRQGEVSRVDGPYAEAKEVVGGWAIMQYDTVEEAIAIANDTEYGLSAGVWGRDEAKTLDVARQLAGGRPDPLPPGFEITGARSEDADETEEDGDEEAREADRAEAGADQEGQEGRLPQAQHQQDQVAPRAARQVEDALAIWSGCARRRLRPRRR